MDVDCLGHTVRIDTAYVNEPPEEIVRQVDEYAAGSRREFDLTVSFPDGFDGRVGRALSEIPYGETRSYGELADDLDTSPRAVGGGCARNPIPLVVPCHRVLRSDGSVGGFQYPGLKERLLELESGHVSLSEW